MVEGEGAHRRRSRPWCEKGWQKYALERGLKRRLKGGLKRGLKRGLKSQVESPLEEELWRSVGVEEGNIFWGVFLGTSKVVYILDLYV